MIHLTYLLLYPPKRNPSVWWDERGRDNGGGWFIHHNDSKVSTYWRERNPKDVTMDLDGIQTSIMGRMNQFGWLVCCSLKNSLGRPIGRIFAHLGVHRGWTNLNSHLWWENHHRSNVDNSTIWSKWWRNGLCNKCIGQRSICFLEYC
jgi:hypothetical protein